MFVSKNKQIKLSQKYTKNTVKKVEKPYFS